MSIKQRIKDILPASVEKGIKLRREDRDLRATPKLECNPETLRPATELDLAALFHDSEVAAAWAESAPKIEALGIPDGTGGVNPGDRRAIYYLIRKLRPASVLEVGTHIGASTVHIAEAIGPGGIVTVDVADVNDAVNKPWLRHGMQTSPAESLERMGLRERVEFVTDTSTNYLARRGRDFDFIFLDGDHGARTVYHEIPAALDSLRSGGVILLHDYFPDLRPLWSDGSAIPGPFLATERLKEEGAKITVLPLGELPWPTKLQSNYTSLAVLLKTD